MSDVILIAVVVGFFALAALYVRACELLVGRPEPGRADRSDVDRDAPRPDPLVDAE